MRTRARPAGGTAKQVRYALYLLGRAGYSVVWMNARFKALGASMRERSGRVEDWLGAKNFVELSNLIEALEDELTTPDATP